MAAVLLAGLPYMLARFIGWPLPGHPPTWPRLRVFLTTPLSDDAIIKGLACVVWLLWAIFALSVIVEVIAAVRGRPAPRLPVIAPVQAFAAALIGATVLTAVPVTQASPRAFPLQHALATHTVAAAPPRPGQPYQATAPAAPSATLDAHTTSSGALNKPVTPRPKIHRVVKGDNLWDIAARFLGNGERWHEIYDLNAGKPQPDGQTLSDPDLIYPGWVLLLPAGPASHPGSGTPGHHPRHGRTPGRPRPVPSSPSPQPPSPSPSRGSPRPVPSRHPSVHAHPRPHGNHNSSVDLPSGAIIGLSLATATGLAIVIARLHRRRRREPTPVPGTAPAEPALSPALRLIRQAHLDAVSQQLPDEDTGSAGAYLPAPPLMPADGQDIPPRREPSTETINVAVRDGEEISLDLACVPGIGLTGPGAADVIRAIAVTLLARRTRDQAEVLLCGEDACRLLTADDGPDPAEVPGLTAFNIADDGLSRLEAEIIHRRRLLDADGDDDLAAYRDANPDEYLSTILAIALARSPRARRLAAVLTLGQRLGITGILPGAWPSPGATCEVAADGQVISVSAAELRHLEGTQMFQLAPGETADILTTLAAASGAAPPDTEPGPPRPLPAPPAEPSEPVATERAVQLAILGPFQLYASGELITKGLRRKAAELLTYLAIHRDGATTDAILDALWQDTPAGRAAPILHAATTNIRKILRAATGASEAGFIVRIGDHLRIDEHLVGTDLWRFQDALASAAHTNSDDDRLASLQAADLWRSDLAPGIDSVWIDEHRETLRRDAVDTLARLAELCEPQDPEHALAHLEHAISIDRYQEPLYRRIMRIQGSLGRPDAARRTYQLLESRLTHIDAEPDEITVQILNEVLHRHEASSVRDPRLR